MTIANHRFTHIEYSLKIPATAGAAPPLTWHGRFDASIVAVSNLLARIATLQTSVAEIYCDQETSFLYRLGGLIDGYRIRFVDRFEDAYVSESFFKVVFSDETPDSNELPPGVIAVFSGAETCVRRDISIMSRLRPNDSSARCWTRSPPRTSASGGRWMH